MRTFIRCAKLHPAKRECKSCRHTCAIRGERFEDFADSHEEKAISMWNQDQRDLAKESIPFHTGNHITSSIILNPEEAI